MNWSGFFQDLRYGTRGLLNDLRFTGMVVSILGLSIATTVTTFSIVRGVLLRPLPYRDADQLVVFHETHQKKRSAFWVNTENFLDWREQSQTFATIAAVGMWGPVRRGADYSERVRGVAVSADLFSLLDVRPVLGRTFLFDEDRPGAKNVVLVTHRFWQERFGTAPQIIGESLVLDDISYTVIGVLPWAFRFPLPKYDEQPQIAKPLSLGSSDRGGRYLNVLARLRPGVSLRQAQAEMSTIARRLEQEHPETNRDWGVELVPLQTEISGDPRIPILLLLAASGAVLLTGLANVAGLLLVRAARRHKEVGVRMALGASRGRLICQFLAEGILLSTLGGSLGILLAYSGMPLLMALAVDFPRMDEVHIDGIVLAFTLLVSVSTSIVFALIPVSWTSKTDFAAVLKQGGGRSVGRMRNRAQGLLVITEVALALVLLVGTGLMIRTFVKLRGIQYGLDTKNILTSYIWLPKRYREGYQRVDFFQEAVRRLGMLPGIRAVTMISQHPLTKPFPHHLQVEGHPPTEGAEGAFYIIDPQYFRVMGIPLQRGRQFTDRDARESRVAIVNQTMARRFWPSEDPIGKRIIMLDVDWEIVGVVGDIRHYAFDKDQRLQVYVPLLALPTNAMHVMVRVAKDPGSFVSVVPRTISGIDKGVSADQIQTMEEFLADLSIRPRFQMVLLGIFSALALILATAGLYGLVSYQVARDTHEIGIRMALGAEASDILLFYLRRGALFCLSGLGVGIAGALALSRLVSKLLYQVAPTDPMTLVIVTLCLCSAALLASYVPARRATKANPAVALRHE